MNIIDLVTELGGGELSHHQGFARIIHNNGDVSHFYCKNESINSITELPSSIRFLYENFSGLDLFSSTFKISSIQKEVIVNGVSILGTLDELAYQMEDIIFPERCIPFMNETGNYIYAASYNSENIFCFDIEYGEITQYQSVKEIITDWYLAVHDK